MKKILLPTDFSDNANQAIDYAFNLFGFEDVNYVLLHSFEEPSGSADMLVSINDILQKQATEDLDKLYNQLLKKYPKGNLAIEKHLEYGSLGRVLKVTVKEENVDYIVMGTKGASGLKKAFIGSNTSTVIRKVKCPIITVPEQIEYRPIKNIALATDYNGLDNDLVLQPLSALLRQTHSRLLVVNVTREKVMAGNYESETKGMNLGHMFKGIDQTFYSLEGSDVVDSVKSFVREHNIDMLVMIAKEHPLFDRLFAISLTKEMSMAGEVPLMILHDTTKP